MELRQQTLGDGAAHRPKAAKSDRHRTSFNARNREKERAAPLPEPPGLNDAVPRRLRYCR
jgi:hypothetical protein